MTCSQCGTEIPAGCNGCPACGWGAVPKITLSGSEGSLSSAIDLEFGKSLAGKVVGEDAKYMDDIQFFLNLRGDTWYVKPHPRLRNPVWLNGTQLDTESPLSDGDELSLKGKAGFIKVNYS